LERAVSGRDWAPGEKDAAFVAYCLAFAGSMPTFSVLVEPHVAVAVALGAADRIFASEEGRDIPAYRWRVVEVVAQTLAERGESPEAGEAAEPPDATADALAAYAEGVGDTLEALETWWNGPDGLPESLSSWLSSRRAAAPRRPMTAGEVLERIEAWAASDGGPVDIMTLCALLRREIGSR
jgi:hypothetical protein